MNPRTPVARHQIRRLEQLRALGLCTDESLASHLREVGEPCDRTTLVRYRAGDRSASLGLLDLVLPHVDDPAAVLSLWARDYGLRVVEDVDPDAPPRGLGDQALEEVAERTGSVVGVVRAALADGQVTPQERQAVAEAAAELRRAAAELEALVSRTPQRRTA